LSKALRVHDFLIWGCSRRPSARAVESLNYQSQERDSMAAKAKSRCPSVSRFRSLELSSECPLSRPTPRGRLESKKQASESVEKSTLESSLFSADEHSEHSMKMRAMFVLTPPGAILLTERLLFTAGPGTSMQPSSRTPVTKMCSLLKEKLPRMLCMPYFVGSLQAHTAILSGRARRSLFLRS
jgi:hypothetical protein